LRKAGIGSAMVRMIDAHEAGRSLRGVRELETQEIASIADALKEGSAGQMATTVWVKDVPIQEILENGSVLDVRRYIISGGPPASLGKAVKELNTVVGFMSKAFGSIGDSLAQLKPTDALDLDSIPSTGLKRIRLAGESTPSDIVQSFFKTRRQGEEWTTDDVHVDDVVVCLMGIHVGVAVSGKEFVSTRIAWPKIWILRSKGREVAPAYLLAWARYGGLEQQANRLITGSTVPTITNRDVGQITLPIVDMETQQLVARWGQQLDELSVSLSAVEDIEADFMIAAKGVTAAYFVELDKRERTQ